MAIPKEMLGHWHILATTLNFWRGKRNAGVEYTELPDGRWLDRLTWNPARGGGTKRLEGYDTWQDECFQWRGKGPLFWIKSQWRVVKLAPDGRWAVTWFSQSSFGITPQGMDIYSRTPKLPELDEIVEQLRRDPEFSHLDGWYATERG